MVTVVRTTLFEHDDHCVDCGTELNAATSMGGYVPSPGDSTICLKCGHIMVFDDNLRVRQPTDAEMQCIAGDPEVIAIQRARGKL